ncbi:MAG: lpxD [Herminiimonas sp.]|nr:lpxD [Herminiimonas sp.]
MSIRLGELTQRLGGQLVGDSDLAVSSVAPLDSASHTDISFFTNPKLLAQASLTGAAAIIVSPANSAKIEAGYHGARILTDNPYAYFARVAQLFAEQVAVAPTAGIHRTAVVDPSAIIAPSASIGPHVTIEAGAMIGDRCVVGSGAFIGRNARIGAGTRFYSHVVFHDGCQIGERGILHPGAVIGADGFGFAQDQGKWIKIPQTGAVRIGNDVEIGANTTVDRGALADTVIEDGVKLDNQIQIAHNCHIGAHTAMAGCVGVAGSAVIGKHCTFGGAAMVLGHLSIADNVHISSGSMVTRSIHEPGQYTGIFPLAKNADWEKSAAIVRNLGAMREKIRELEKTVKMLVEKNNEQS